MALNKYQWSDDPVQSFQTWQVMRRSLRVCGQLALPLLAIGLFAHCPQIIGGMPQPQQSIDWEEAQLQLLDVILGQLLSGAIAYAVVLKLRGVRVSLWQIQAATSRQIFPIVAVGMVSQLTVLLMNLQPLFGLLALFVITLLFVSVPVAMMEQPGVAESLRRSARLSAGSRWSILGVLGIFVLITLLADLILYLVFGAQGEVPEPGYQVALAVFHGALAIFGSVVAAVTYLELRRLRAV